MIYLAWTVFGVLYFTVAWPILVALFSDSNFDLFKHYYDIVKGVFLMHCDRDWET